MIPLERGEANRLDGLSAPADSPRYQRRNRGWVSNLLFSLIRGGPPEGGTTNEAVRGGVAEGGGQAEEAGVQGELDGMIRGREDRLSVFGDRGSLGAMGSSREYPFFFGLTGRGGLGYGLGYGRGMGRPLAIALAERLRGRGGHDGHDGHDG